MKKILTILFLFMGSYLCAQSNDDVLFQFCRNEYKVPDGCKKISENRIDCDNYSMQWQYGNNAFLTTMPEQYVQELKKKNNKKFKKKPITCYLLNYELKGFKVSFKTDSGMTYKLITSGIVNKKIVLFQLSLFKEAKTNEDIPEFPREFIKLTK